MRIGNWINEIDDLNEIPRKRTRIRRLNSADPFENYVKTFDYRFDGCHKVVEMVERDDRSEKFIVSTVGYDSEGRLRRVERTGGMGRRMGVITIDYNSRGLPTAAVYLDESGAPHESILLSYDESGSIISQYELSDAAGEVERVGTFFKDDRATERITAGDPELKGEVVEAFVYDGKGRLAEVRVSEKAGGLVSSLYYYYDAEGRMIYELHVDPDGGTIDKTEYRYDQAGNMTVKVTCAPNGLRKSAFMKKYGSDGRLESTAEARYGENGDIVKSVEVIHEYFAGEMSGEKPLFGVNEKNGGRHSQTPTAYERTVTAPA